MTESQTGPPGGTGPGGQPGEMPAGAGTGMGASSVGGPGSDPASGSPGMNQPGSPEAGTTGAGTTGAGTTGAGSTSGIATARRTSAAQTSVPQQLGHQQERIAGESEMGMPGAVLIPESMSAAAKATWGAVLLAALGLIALGIALLVWPNASLTVVAILIGAAVAVAGLYRLYEGFTASSQSGGMRAGNVVIGLIAVLAGVYLLRHHALSLFFVAFVTGVFFIMQGFSDLGIALSGRVPGRGLRAVLGVFSLAAGIIMVIWPAITLGLLLLIVAAWLLFYGCVLVALAFGLRRAAKAATPASMPSQQRLAASTR
jgi:uncharacterized membrane protein HdeD (DUF308 family)